MALKRRSKNAESEFFPGFTHVEEIGGGGFATVFSANEVETGRPVALKLLNIRDISEHALESFRRETLALGALSTHPNIVTLYRTLTTADGRPVLVMELCKGSVSQQTKAEGGVAPRDAVAICVKIGGALETAHRADMLHRDVKPQNILVTQYGEPALADFGVARLQSSSEATAGVFGFTTLHAAPEMLEGTKASAATDVYELASTLYHLLAGRAAFRSFDGEAPAAVILRILRDPVQPLLMEGVPIALSDLLVWSMAKNPDERPHTALEFADRLRDIEASQGWPVTSYAVIGDDPTPWSSRDNGTHTTPAPEALMGSPDLMKTGPPVANSWGAPLDDDHSDVTMGDAGMTQLHPVIEEYLSAGDDEAPRIDRTVLPVASAPPEPDESAFFAGISRPSFLADSSPVTPTANPVPPIERQVPDPQVTTYVRPVPPIERQVPDPQVTTYARPVPPIERQVPDPQVTTYVRPVPPPPVDDRPSPDIGRDPPTVPPLVTRPPEQPDDLPAPLTAGGAPLTLPASDQRDRSEVDPQVGVDPLSQAGVPGTPASVDPLVEPGLAAPDRSVRPLSSPADVPIMSPEPLAGTVTAQRIAAQEILANSLQAPNERPEPSAAIPEDGVPVPASGGSAQPVTAAPLISERRVVTPPVVPREIRPSQGSRSVTAAAPLTGRQTASDPLAAPVNQGPVVPPTGRPDSLAPLSDPGAPRFEAPDYSSLNTRVESESLPPQPFDDPSAVLSDVGLRTPVAPDAAVGAAGNAVHSVPMKPLFAPDATGVTGGSHGAEGILAPELSSFFGYQSQNPTPADISDSLERTVMRPGRHSATPDAAEVEPEPRGLKRMLRSRQRKDS